MTVERAQAGFAGGAFTSESLTQAFLDRIAVYNRLLQRDRVHESQRARRRQGERRRRASGKSLGPLDGVPVVVKDAMDMAGFPTTGGWRLLHSKTGGVDLYPATDAPVVARMRAAGAVILGKTNIPVLSATGSHANDSWAGPHLQRAGREFLPGGSSAGTATAVGASLAVLGLAEETGGSIQNPASAQGLVGIKPTFALVPNVGVLPLSSLRDVVGPIARCVRDAALTLDALAGFTMADPKTVAGVGRRPPGGYAANLKPDALQRQADRHIRARVAQPAALGGSGGALPPRAWRNRGAGRGSGRGSVRRLRLRRPARRRPCPARNMTRAGSSRCPTISANISSGSDPTRRSRPSPSSRPRQRPRIRSRLPACSRTCRACRRSTPASANPTKPPDMSAFIALREKHLAIFNEVFARHRLDAVVFPQMREQLAAREAKDIIHETTVSEINIAGLPGVTVPAGYYASGSPFNLIASGRCGARPSCLASLLPTSRRPATENRRLSAAHDMTPGRRSA